MKVGDMICVADFHDLCPRHKVSVMEFELIAAIWRAVNGSRMSNREQNVKLQWEDTQHALAYLDCGGELSDRL